jgi:hypothetical protein
MNEQLKESAGFVEGTLGMREQVLGLLTDADLDYKLPGDNPTLRDVLKEGGLIQASYTDSFKTFKHDWGILRRDETANTQSIASIRAWYEKLTAEMMQTLEGVSDADVASKTIDRGGFEPSVKMQADIYVQALLIFFAKTNVYLRALQKPLTEQLQSWIG